jgi:hypothetical protein
VYREHLFSTSAERVLINPTTANQLSTLFPHQRELATMLIQAVAGRSVHERAGLRGDVSLRPMYLKVQVRYKTGD